MSTSSLKLLQCLPSYQKVTFLNKTKQTFPDALYLQMIQCSSFFWPLVPILTLAGECALSTTLNNGILKALTKKHQTHQKPCESMFAELIAPPTCQANQAEEVTF